MRGVLITRPGEAGKHLCDTLQAQNITAIHLPLLTIQGQALSPADKTALLNLDGFARVIVVSRPAAEYFVEHLDQYWPQPPVDVQYFAVGDASAAPLRDYGLIVQIPQQANSEGLLALPQLQQAGKTLIAKGGQGRPLLAEQLRLRGSEVVTIDFYQRIAQSVAPSTLKALADYEELVLCLTSVAALASWQQLGFSPTKLTLVCASQRIAKQAQDMGYQRCVVAAGANNTAQQQCIETLLATP